MAVTYTTIFPRLVPTVLIFPTVYIFSHGPHFYMHDLCFSLRFILDRINGGDLHYPLSQVSSHGLHLFPLCMTYAFHTSDKLCFILDLMNGGDLHYHLSQVSSHGLHFFPTLYIFSPCRHFFPHGLHFFPTVYFSSFFLVIQKLFLKEITKICTCLYTYFHYCFKTE